MKGYVLLRSIIRNILLETAPVHRPKPAGRAYRGPSSGRVKSPWSNSSAESDEEPQGDRNVLGEPDLAKEKERDDPKFHPPEEEHIDEINTVGAVMPGVGTGPEPSGNIRGFQAPLGYSGEDMLGYKKKDKKKKKKKKK